MINQYLKALKDCLILVKDSKTYEDICQKYELLKKEINSLLEKMDALCIDAERYIDKNTGSLRDDIGINLDEIIRFKFEELCDLYNEKKIFYSKYNWDDNLLNRVEVVLAIANYEKLEKEIIESFGYAKGEQIIYETKKEAVSFEKEIGVEFFSSVVEKLEVLFRIRNLYPLNKNIDILGLDNINSQKYQLINDNGEVFDVEKIGEINYRNKTYLEFDLLDFNKLNYYKLVLVKNKQKFILVEDKELDKILNKRQEKLY